MSLYGNIDKSQYGTLGGFNESKLENGDAFVLPVVNPMIEGALWNDGGVISISTQYGPNIAVDSSFDTVWNTTHSTSLGDGQVSISAPDMGNFESGRVTLNESPLKEFTNYRIIVTSAIDYTDYLVRFGNISNFSTTDGDIDVIFDEFIGISYFTTEANPTNISFIATTFNAPSAILVDYSIQEKYW